MCVITPDGDTVRTKTPSTPHDQSVGVKNGIDLVRKLLVEKYNWDGEFEAIHHGTTVGKGISMCKKSIGALYMGID